MIASLMAMHMNRFVYLFKNNFLAVLVFLLLAAIAFFAWFFFHPSSPYHERQTFVIYFEKIGSLASGSLVRVNGMEKGKVLSTELTEDGVYVKVCLFADYNVPKNSSFRLINTGLVGKQEVSILAGDASGFLISGDTVNGLTDQGFSEISRNLFLILNELDTIKVTISSFIDTITNGSIGKSLYSVEKKTRFLTQDTKNKVTSWITELRKVKEAALSIIPEDPKIKKDIDLLLGDLNQLEKELEQLQQELASISFEIPEKGTVGQILKDSSPFLKKIDSLKVNIDLLIEEIKKKGLALNIDIF
jgi:phospholipid/cholesterol/gamma-HCH transport system substrate-binding protein